MFNKSRRDFLFRSGQGIGGLALAHLLNQDGLLAAGCENIPGVTSPFSPKLPHFKPRAKNVISLFMCGGVSHLDTFDPKPALDKFHGDPLPGERDIQVQQGYPGPVMRSPYQFKKYGQSGMDVSELFPHLATIVDEIADPLRRRQVQRPLALAFRVDHRRSASGVSELRRVGDVRAWHGKSEPARICRDLRSPRRSVQRAE
jgi:hypothetical protein